MPFLTLLMGNWKLVALGVLLLTIGVQTWRLERCQKRYEEYRISVEAIARAQEAETKRIIAEREKIAKETQDALKEQVRDLDAKYASARKRLREQPGAGAVSTLASAAASLCPKPDALLAGRLADLEGRILTLLEGGDREIAKYRQLWEYSAPR